MTINTAVAEPAPIAGGTRQEAREAKRRKRVVRLVMLVAVGRTAVSTRTLAGVIVIAIGVAAAKRMASERGTPALDWYRALGRDKNHHEPQKR
jgi:hypothetical protein